MLGRSRGWILSAILLAGCAPIVPPQTPTVALNVSVPIHPSSISHLQPVRGTLAAQDGCLFLREADGVMIGVAWPPETRWNPALNAIIVNDVAASLGESVELVGARYEVEAEDISRMPWIKAPRPECLGDEFWFVGDLSIANASIGP